MPGATDPNYPTRVNRVPYSFGSCASFIAGVPIRGITGVDWSEKREVKLVRDADPSGVPIGITAGLYSIDSFKFRCLRDTATFVKQLLTVKGQGSFGDAEWSFTEQIYEPVQGSTPITTTIFGSRIIGVGNAREIGVEELVQEFTVQPIALVETVNGVSMQLWSKLRELL